MNLDMGIEHSPMFFEIDLERLFKALERRRGAVAQVSLFPPATRDIALVIDRASTHEKVLGAIAKFPKRKHLVDALLFDLYEGPNITADKKSLAYALTYQSLERTLNDKEVEQIREKIIQRLEKELKATLRE